MRDAEEEYLLKWVVMMLIAAERDFQEYQEVLRDHSSLKRPVSAVTAG